ncbi:papain-like cysteine protease family protein [Phytomonospora sp. NPDC050363]|uniref:papain-like cysteine protease family protein n=1 Tax=Phytomonospora sp. NPDC050363 TaxID=3155642 RepID=UPI0033FA4392
MPLSAPELAILGDTPITIRSTAFPNVCLRLDGRGVTSTTTEGAGTVNCQFAPGATGPYEKFKLRKQADGSFSFESIAFPNVYLRLDGTGVTTQTTNGGGKVNCQFNANGGAREKFKLNAQPDGSFSIESVASPNVFLRMIATGLTAPAGAGGGLVNAQFNANGGSHEKFVIAMADQRLAFAEQHQQQTQWCWAATTVSINAYYDPATAWTQCKLVNEEYELDNCCGAAGSGTACNRPWYPDLALRRTGNLNQYLNRALSLVEVGAEMNKSAPFGVGTYWAGGGGHAVVVRGRFVSNGVEYVSVADPWDGDSDVTYDNFLNRYKDSGTWRTTYTTTKG